MRIPRQQLEKARIEIIPMIDIIFFLLVFFEEAAPAGANTLGPSATYTPTDQPVKSIEGGESGADELSDRGDLPVVPGTGGSGENGGPGRAGLGWGSEGSGARLGGLRPGAGGEGPGGGVGSLARPLGATNSYPDTRNPHGGKA